MNFVIEKLTSLAIACHLEIDHFQSVVDESGFSPELRERAKDQIATWQHRKEQCDNALLVLENSGCKKD